MNYLTITLCFVLANVAYISGTILCARALRIPMEQVAIFNGPRLFLRSWRGCIWEVRLLPLGSFVRYHEDAYYAKPKGLRILLLLAGPALTGLVGACLVPLSVPDLFSAVWTGTLHPAAVGSHGLRNFWTLCSHDPITAVGSFLGMHAFINLLPNPISNGGQIVLTIVVDRRRSRIRDALMWFGIGLAVALLMVWSTALYAAIWR